MESFPVPAITESLPLPPRNVLGSEVRLLMRSLPPSALATIFFREEAGKLLLCPLTDTTMLPPALRTTMVSAPDVPSTVRSPLCRVVEPPLRSRRLSNRVIEAEPEIVLHIILSLLYFVAPDKTPVAFRKSP